MPYGYYEFVRFVALIGFGILAYKANEQNKRTEMVIFGALALLYQPFSKIALGRTLWNIVDIVVGIGLIRSLFISREKTNAKSHTHLQSHQPTSKQNCKRVCLVNTDKEAE